MLLAGLHVHVGQSILGKTALSTILCIIRVVTEF